MVDVPLTDGDGGPLDFGDGTALVGLFYDATPPAAPVFTAADFAAGLQALLPRGRAWPREPDAVQSQVIAALGAGFARVHARANALLVDAFPSTAVGLLTEWEDALGLPDACAGAQPTVALRQRAVVARLAARGGQSIAYFTGLAAALGAAITITEFAPARADFACADDACADEDWASMWQVAMPSTTIDYALADAADADDPIETSGGRIVECTLERYKPAHGLLTFTYTGASSGAPLGVFVLGRDALV